jgi:hypothetical protein
MSISLEILGRALLLGSMFVAPFPTRSATIGGSFQEEFTCNAPGPQCSTTCVGPGGPITIDNYKVLKAYQISQPDRLWLQTDSGKTIVLGVADRCTFGGVADTIVTNPANSPLGPYQPARICIGQQCL